MSAQPAFGQTQGQGIIRTDTVWRGQIEIKSDVVITGAAVHVEAGSTIRFMAAGRGGTGLIISLRTPMSVSTEPSPPARLLLDGTPDRPITVETAESITPGLIDGGPGMSSAISARHVIFRRLGWPTPKGTCKPAISIQLAAPDNDLWITECRFERCGPVRAGFIGPEGTADISRCTFVNTIGPTALAFIGPGSGIKVIRDNVADAAIEAASPQTLIRGNVLVGDFAALLIRNPLANGINVIGNYIHSTLKEDVGRYCLRCEAANTSVTDNVLAGGSYVLEATPAIVRHNVLIGTGDLRATFGRADPASEVPKMATMTHSLVTNVCPNAIVADNLLLGPAYATVDLGRGSGGLQIEHNVFDGWGAARRALRFDITARDVPKIDFIANTIVGYRQAPISNEAKPEPALHAGKNVFVGLIGPEYQGLSGLTDIAPSDRRTDGLSQAGLAQTATQGSPATQAAADVDELLLTRRKTPADVHKAWFDIYRLPPAVQKVEQ